MWTKKPIYLIQSNDMLSFPTPLHLRDDAQLKIWTELTRSSKKTSKPGNRRCSKTTESITQTWPRQTNHDGKQSPVSLDEWQHSGCKARWQVHTMTHPAGRGCGPQRGMGGYRWMVWLSQKCLPIRHFCSHGRGLSRMQQVTWCS